MSFCANQNEFVQLTSRLLFVANNNVSRCIVASMLSSTVIKEYHQVDSFVSMNHLIRSVDDFSTEEKKNSHSKKKKTESTFMATLTTVVTTDGSRSLLSGSTVEGQTYARHLANQNIQDIDILIHCGVVKSEDNLIRTPVPGFIRIKFDHQIQASGTTQLLHQQDSDGTLCLNGLKLKKEHCTPESEEVIGAPLSYIQRTVTTASDSSDAAATQTISYRTIDLSKQFRQALDQVEIYRDQLNFETISEKYERFARGVCESITEQALPLYRTASTRSVFDEQSIDEQTFRDLFALVGPAYGYSLPKKMLVRIQSLLDFYHNYENIGNATTITDTVDYFQSCAPIDADLVPSLQLKFWPTDIQPFLNRIKVSRPTIYELIINKTTMHVIPKWSGRTPPCDRELEFRYSFSAVELILAQERSCNEKILNGIARSIYYKFLKNQKVCNRSVIPSYFIKTTVLWMCEEQNLNDDSPNTLAEKWLKYATERLIQRWCSHYIIPDLNILEPFPAALLEKAREILLEVNPNEIHDIQMFSASGQEFYRNKYDQSVSNFLGKLKMIDIMDVLHGYRQFKQHWLRLNSDQANDKDETDLAHALTILNTLRALDGDYDNWKKFRQIYVDHPCSLFPPIWGETVKDDSAVDFTHGLLSVGVILTFVNKNITLNESEREKQGLCNEEDFRNYQNVTHQYLDPKTLHASMQSTYSYWYNRSSSAFERRKVTDDHPDGPQMTHSLLESKSDLYRWLIDCCHNDCDKTLTLKELFQQQPVDNWADDEELAMAIQRSMED